MNTLVSFELAKLLKEKGYNEPCRYFYDGYSKRTVECLSHTGINELNGDIDIPTIAEVVCWIYSKHEIWVYVDFYNENRWFGVFRNKEGVKTELFDVLNSPTEAYEAAIQYTLNNLI